jgi:DNA-binding NarL/FixJ family response regulator
MISVAIVDDHPVYRQGLAAAVEAADDLALVGDASSIEEFEKLVTQADVVLLDLHLPGIEGSAGVAHVCGKGHRVLVVSAAESRKDVVDAIAAGAVGYLTKESDAEEITRAIRTVASGASYVSPTLASFLLKAEKETAAYKLTKREREVLALVAAGETDQDIAEQLFIATTTVHSHLERIRDKTGARRRAELTNLAHKLGDQVPPAKQRPGGGPDHRSPHGP